MSKTINDLLSEIDGRIFFTINLQGISDRKIRYLEIELLSKTALNIITCIESYEKITGKDAFNNE